MGTDVARGTDVVMGTDVARGTDVVMGTDVASSPLAARMDRPRN